MARRRLRFGVKRCPVCGLFYKSAAKHKRSGKHQIKARLRRYVG